MRGRGRGIVGWRGRNRAVAGDVMWEEVESRKDNVGWGADREGELVDGEMWG